MTMNETKSPAPLSLLALSGSLRAASSNTALLLAARLLAPQSLDIEVFDGIGDLPHFNPDLDGENGTRAVTDFRARLRSCDGVLICCPEYAHGVPGSFKNALDWIVGSGELMNKPVALLKVSVHGTHAHESLRETLSVMMAQIIPAASITIALGRNNLTAQDIASDAFFAASLRAALGDFEYSIRQFESGLATT